MRYDVELKPRARKDLQRIAKRDAVQIVDAMEKLKDDLLGDVKRLTAFTPEYRLRVWETIVCCLRLSSLGILWSIEYDIGEMPTAHEESQDD